jgi:hypothetical protein
MSCHTGATVITGIASKELQAPDGPITGQLPVCSQLVAELGLLSQIIMFCVSAHRCRTTRVQACPAPDAVAVGTRTGPVGYATTDGVAQGEPQPDIPRLCRRDHARPIQCQPSGKNPKAPARLHLLGAKVPAMGGPTTDYASIPYSPPQLALRGQ